MSLKPLKFYKGTLEKSYTEDIPNDAVLYTTDDGKLSLDGGKTIVGEKLTKLDVGNNNTLVINKGMTGGAAAIGKDNIVGKMGFYIFPTSYDITNNKITFEMMDHQVGNYPEECEAKIKAAIKVLNESYTSPEQQYLKQEYNSDVFDTGVNVPGLEKWAFEVGYYDTYCSHSLNSDNSTTITYRGDRPEQITELNNKTVTVVINKKIVTGVVTVDATGYTLTVSSGTSVESIRDSYSYLYNVPDDIWTNDWSLYDNDTNEDTRVNGPYNIAEPTFAMGRRNKAYASESFVIGRDNIARGDVSVAMGVENEAAGPGSFATGKKNHSTGNWSSTFGMNNWATGPQSAAFGNGNNAHGQNSFTIGDTNTIESAGKNSLAVGYSNTVSNERAMAIGAENKSEGVDSFTAGNNNTVNNKANAAIGMGLTGTPYSDDGLAGQVVVGAYNSTLDNDTYFAVGTGTASYKETTLEVKSGTVSVDGRVNAETLKIGTGSISSTNSLIVGDTNTIAESSNNTFASGFRNTVSKTRAAAIGADNTADGVDSFAMGNGNTTSKKATAVIGMGLNTGDNVPMGCVVVGAYNNPLDNDTYFAVGTGDEDTKATTLKVTSGAVYVTGSVNASTFAFSDGGTSGTISVTGDISATNKVQSSEISATSKVQSPEISATTKIQSPTVLVAGGRITISGTKDADTHLKIGTLNTVTGKLGLATGDNNTLSGNNSIVSGQNNTNGAASTFMTGFKNESASTSTNTIVAGQYNKVNSILSGLVVGRGNEVESTSVGALICGQCADTSSVKDCYFAVGNGSFDTSKNEPGTKSLAFYVTGGVTHAKTARFIAEASIGIELRGTTTFNTNTVMKSNSWVAHTWLATNGKARCDIMANGETTSAAFGKLIFDQYVFTNSNSNVEITGSDGKKYACLERFQLPTPTPGNFSNYSASTSGSGEYQKWYNILTTKNTVTVAQGGTGKATHTSNAVLTGNGTSALKNVATASGAFYATSANGAPQFGTLPIAQGGTGKTTAADARENLGIGYTFKYASPNKFSLITTSTIAVFNTSTYYACYFKQISNGYVYTVPIFFRYTGTRQYVPVCLGPASGYIEIDTDNSYKFYVGSVENNDCNLYIMKASE